MKSPKSARVLVMVGMAVAALTIGAQPVCAQRAVAVLIGLKQGAIQGDETSKVYGPGSIVLLGVGHSLTVPFDPASGLPTGKRQHGPLQIIRLPDKSSPKLLQALVTNESLTVEIKFFRTVSTSAVVLYHTFKLTNASINSIQTGGDTSAPNGVTEGVSFTYGKVEVIDHVNNVVVSDTWQWRFDWLTLQRMRTKSIKPRSAFVETSFALILSPTSRPFQPETSFPSTGG